MTESWKPLEGQTVLGEFELGPCLSSTEDGAVFSATPVEDESKKIAVRFIRSDSAGAARRRSQWDLASRLSHPHLVGVDRTGACDLGEMRLVFAVMDHAEEVLADVLPHRPLSASEVRKMLGPVLEALVYLHGHSLVHGRLKPSNLMSVSETLKVSSDGVYRTGESMADQGASPYSAPEQETQGASPAGDVWALGVTLVEVLTQIPGSDVKQAGALPAPFDEIVRHCLLREPGRRWTVEQIAAHLGHSFVLPLKSAGFGGGSQSFARRLVLPAVGIAVLAAVIVYGPGLPDGSPDPPEKSPEPVQLAAVQPAAEEESAPAPEPEPEPPEPEPESQAEPEPEPDEEVAEEPTEEVAAASAEDEPEESEPEPPEEPVVVAEAEPLPAGVTKRVSPQVVPSALATIEGTVRVSVTAIVDTRGQVATTIMEDPGPSQYFARASQEAAGQWEFEPSDNAAGAATQWLLRFEFTQTQVRTFAERPGVN